MLKFVQKVLSVKNGTENTDTAINMPKWVRWSIVAVEVFLVISLGYLASQLFTHVIIPSHKNTALALPPMMVNQNRNEHDYSQLTRFDPFFRQIKAVPVQQVQTVRETTLKIKLFGLRAEENGAGNAIVQMDNGQQKLVQTGETITNGVQLVGVYADRIEITRRGAREAVYMYKNKRTSRGQFTGEGSSKFAGANVDTTTKTGLLSQVVEALLALNLVPARENNRIVGFRLSSDVTGGIIPLEKGDIIQSINGYRLKSFENLQELPSDLEGSSTFRIEFLRNGQGLIEIIE